MSDKMSRATRVVVMAQRMYPQYLKAVKSYLGPIPYGQQQVDPRTADKQLVRMAPEDLAQLAASDPIAGLTAQRRLETLQQRASEKTPLPAPDSFEEK